MVFRPILALVAAIVTVTLSLVGASVHAATESDVSRSGVRFITPSIYCEIANASPAETALFTRARDNGGLNMELVGLFADCAQKKTWQDDPAKEPARFGAAFLHRSGDSLKPIMESRIEYVKRLATLLNSWEQSSPKQLLERMVQGAIEGKPQRVQIMATTPEAIFIGFIAETVSGDDGKKTLAGVSAISLIKQIPVSLHLYRTFDSERTVGALLPEAMGLMDEWRSLNEGSRFGSLARKQHQPTVPDKGQRALPMPGLPPPPPQLTPPDPLADLNLPPLRPAINSDRVKFRALLERGEFETLSQLLAANQAAFDEGRLSESQLLNGYLTFGSADPDIRATLDAWVDAQPTSYLPRLARAIYNTHLGWITRGTAYAQRTTSERFALMTAHFEAAIRDFNAALTRNPKLSVAWQNLLAIAMAEGQPTDDPYRRGIEQVPSSIGLRTAYAYSFHPNWGSGLTLPRESYNATIADRNARWLKLYDTMRADSAAFPALKPIVDSPPYRAARRSFRGRDFATASLKLIDALTTSDPSFALAVLGHQQMAKKDYVAAIRSFNQALQEGPNWSDNLRHRATALRTLARATRNIEAYRHALTDFQSALAADPYDPELLGDIALTVAAIPSQFPDQAEQIFEETWQAPVSCQPHTEPPKRFEVVHTVRSGLPVKLYCTAQLLFDKALVYGGHDFNIREMRGRFYLFTMKFPSLAAQEYEAAIELNADQASIWANYALALHEIGDCRAVAAYQQHIAMCKDGGCPAHVANISRNNLSQLSLSASCGG